MRGLFQWISITAFLVAAMHRDARAEKPRPDRAEPATVTFETFNEGPFENLSDLSGRWDAPANSAVIQTQHPHGGLKSLRLLGGRSEVTWTPPAVSSPVDQLEFHVQRWTKREPFELKVELFDGKQWQPGFDSNSLDAVGRFKRVSTPLTFLPQKIRWTSRTPEQTGVIIDDVQLLPAGPMQIESVTARQIVAPVLVRNRFNPVLEIDVVAIGHQQPESLNEIVLKLEDPTDLADIQSVTILQSPTAALDWKNSDAAAAELAQFSKPQSAARELRFTGAAPLAPGHNRFLVSLTLADNASLDHRLRLTCPSIRAGERAIAPASQGSASPLRIGFAVRKAGDHESQAFRIPGIATTPKGALIAVYDVRRRGWTDLPNDIDIGMSRSTDGGRTWEPMRIVMDMGNDPQFRYDGIGDPSVLVDTTSGTIFVAATWSHGERSWHGSGPGMTPEETGQLMLVKSTDDGLTWSAPINVTSQVKKPEWSFVLPGPGRGITMADGTLVYPAQFRDSPEAKGLPHSTIMVSRDHGKTWQIGTPAFDDTTECAVVESSPGVLMLNCRNNRQPRRVVMTTRDLGRTWTEHSTSRKSLPEPRACMGSLASVAFDGRTWLLFSNPNAETPPRRAMTIKASDNAGETWPEHWHLLIDEGLSAGYSCLTQVDALHAGLLFESSRANIAFVRVPLSELTHVPAPFRAAELQRRIGELQLATPFTDHMVIQRDVEIPVWGTGPPEERIVVRLGDKEVRGKIEATGDWTVRLPAVPVSRDPLKLSVTASGRTVQVSDVLVGDVWLASGQSNMAWPLKSTTDDERLLIDSTDDQLRLFNFQPSVSGLPGSYDLEQRKRLHAGQFFAGTWQRSSPEANADFSAVAFHFAKALRRDRDVPVGIMCCAFGGSPTEAWIRSAALGTDRDLKSFVAGNWLENDHVARWCQERGRANFAVAMSRGDYLISDACGPNHPYKPSFLWETGIQRLVPFPVQGVLWYQGESNAEAAADVEWHRRLFTLLIADWRALWNDPQLPFLFVQLPAIDRPHWPEFRETQRQVASSTARTAMAVTIDTGDRNNVHPKAKRVVGERLAALAAAMIDHSQNAELAKGPVFQKVEVDGHRLRLSFEHTGSSLKTTDVQAPRHFEVAAEDGVFHAANAAIDGQTILLSAPAVAHPTQARYAWTSFPDPAVNFVNSGGYPASPFAISSLSKAGPSAVVPAKVSQ